MSGSAPAPLNSASASNPGLYQVLAAVTKVVKKHKEGLSTYEKIGIGVVSAITVGGIGYAVTRKRKK